MVHSGIAPLDAQLGGVFPGRLHLMTGGPGTGKSTACLQFLHAGLRKGEPVGLVTLDRPTDLASHARSTGLDLEPALRAGRLLLLRFRSEFGRLLDCAGSPEALIDDLRRLIGEIRPARLVVDPVTPFLAAGSASEPALSALAELLDELGATAIVTHPRDVSEGYDARLDAVVQRAAAIVHLSRSGGGINRMQIVQARSRAAPAIARYVLTPGLGLVTVEGANRPTGLDKSRATVVRERVLRGGAPT